MKLSNIHSLKSGWFMRIHSRHLVLLCSLMVSIGCKAPKVVHNATEPVAPRVAATPARAIEEAPQSIPTGLFEQDPKAMSAWVHFEADGRYRLAVRNDFQIPTAVMNEHLNDPFFTNEFAYVGGDFNRDGHQMDRAFIVVDTTVTNENRFGLVVFNAPAGEELPSVHWVLKGRDLSKSVLSAATDVLSLTVYAAGDTEHVCTVQWDKKRAKYSCRQALPQS